MHKFAGFVPRTIMVKWAWVGPKQVDHPVQVIFHKRYRLMKDGGCDQGN